MQLRIVSAKERRTEVLATLETLAQRIDAAKVLAKEAKLRRCLVELESTTVTIDRLIELAADCHIHENADWCEVIKTVAFVAEVVERIHAFFNCKLIPVMYYENWVYNKDSAYSRRNIADRPRGGPRIRKDLPISGRKQQNRTWPTISQGCVSKVWYTTVLTRNQSLRTRPRSVPGAQETAGEFARRAPCIDRGLTDVQ